MRFGHKIKRVQTAAVLGRYTGAPLTVGATPRADAKDRARPLLSDARDSARVVPLHSVAGNATAALRVRVQRARGLRWGSATGTRARDGHRAHRLVTVPVLTLALRVLVHIARTLSGRVRAHATSAARS